MPRQVTSEIITSPDEPNPIRDRLVKEFSGVDSKEKGFALKMRQLWKENLKKLSTEALQSASDRNVASGRRLPDEIKSDPPAFKFDTPEAMAMGLAFASLQSSENLLVEFVQTQSNSLPPTQTDLVVFHAVNLALDELGPDKVPSSFEQWAPLAAAANPLFRFIALRAAMNSASQPVFRMSVDDKTYNLVDGAAKFEFYFGFLRESDPILLDQAIAALACVPTQDAQSAIENFRLQQQQSGNTALTERAASALRTQALMREASR